MMVSRGHLSVGDQGTQSLGGEGRSPTKSARRVVTEPHIAAQAHRHEPTRSGGLLGRLSGVFVRAGEALTAWLGRVLDKVMGTSTPAFAPPSLLGAVENMACARPDIRYVLQGFMHFLAVQEQAWVDHIERLDKKVRAKVELCISVGDQLAFIETQMLAHLGEHDLTLASPVLGGDFGARVQGLILLARKDLGNALDYEDAKLDASRLLCRLNRASGLLVILRSRMAVQAPPDSNLRSCDLTLQERRWLSSIVAVARK